MGQSEDGQSNVVLSPDIHIVPHISQSSDVYSVLLFPQTCNCTPCVWEHGLPRFCHPLVGFRCPGEAALFLFVEQAGCFEAK